MRKVKAALFLLAKDTCLQTGSFSPPNSECPPHLTPAPEDVRSTNDEIERADEATHPESIPLQRFHLSPRKKMVPVPVRRSRSQERLRLADWFALGLGLIFSYNHTDRDRPLL